MKKIIETHILKRFRKWSQDSVFMRLLRNSTMLLSGNMISYGFGLVSLLIVARCLGPHYFGIFVTIQGYIVILDRLFNFQSWQPLIKYGAHAFENRAYDDLKGLFKFGFLLDSASAVIGTLAGVGGAHLLIRWYGLDAHLLLPLQLYCLVILFNLSGVPIAVLRLLNRFDLYILPPVISQVLRFGACLLAYWNQSGLTVFLFIWLICDILNYLILFAITFVELRRNKLTGIFQAPISNIFQKYPNILQFSFSANINASIRMLTKELDILIIGKVLGTSAAGIFKIAKQLASIPTKIMEPLSDAIYPELSRLSAQKAFKDFLRLILRSGFSAGIAALLMFSMFIVFGRTILMVGMGEQYLAAYQPMTLYLVAIVIAIFTFPLTPAILAMEEYKYLFISLTLATAAYFLTLPVFLLEFSLNGAAYAYITFYVFWSSVMVCRLLRLPLR